MTSPNAGDEADYRTFAVRVLAAVPVADAVELLRHAKSVFDNERDAVAWFSIPNVALGGETPLSSLDTDGGARRVDAVLTRLEFGVYA